MKSKSNTPPEVSEWTTVVVFRRWKHCDEIIALFPAVPANNSGTLCQSYEHVGQHGGANYGHCIGLTWPASEKELRPLALELERIGYLLRIVKHSKKATDTMNMVRKAAAGRLFRGESP